MKFKKGRISLDLENDKIRSVNKMFEKVNQNIKHVSSNNDGLRLKSDPRPVLEKNFTSCCIEALVQFLIKNGFDNHLRSKIMTNPTNADFFKILSFLLNKIDPIFDYQSTIEENFSIILKELKYPFNLPKGSRHILGSPHVWPNLVACLKWITELLQYDSYIQKKKSQKEQTAIAKNNIWEQLGEAYLAFLDRSKKWEKFPKTLLSMVKYNIERDKKFNLHKIKKLRLKIRNFAVAKKAFMLFKLFDLVESDNSRMLNQAFLEKKSSFLSLGLNSIKNAEIQFYKRNFGYRTTCGKQLRERTEVYYSFFFRINYSCFTNLYKSQKKNLKIKFNNLATRIKFALYISAKIIFFKSLFVKEHAQLLDKRISLIRIKNNLLATLFDNQTNIIVISKFLIKENLKLNHFYQKIKKKRFQLLKDLTEKESWFLRSKNKKKTIRIQNVSQKYEKTLIQKLKTSFIDIQDTYTANKIIYFQYSAEKIKIAKTLSIHYKLRLESTRNIYVCTAIKIFSIDINTIRVLLSNRKLIENKSV